MSGYQFWHKVRFRPDNGAASVLDLRDEFTDGNGPVRTRPVYRWEREDREDVNRKQHVTPYGLRLEVALTFDIATMADQATLATIVSNLMRSDVAVDLSLDAGVTWREVEMHRPPSPVGFRGKTIGGARFQMEVRCRELLDEMPAMMTDPLPRQIFTNEGMENWTANDPDDWSVVETNGTVNEDNSNQRTGAACAVIAKSVTGDVILRAQLSNILVAGEWAEFGAYVKASTSITSGMQFRVQNTDQTNGWLQSDGKTWGTGVSQKSFDLTTAYQLCTWRFRVDPSFDDTDQYRLAYYHNGAVGQSVYVDDVYLKTPVLPTGVATW